MKVAGSLISIEETLKNVSSNLINLGLHPRKKLGN